MSASAVYCRNPACRTDGRRTEVGSLRRVVAVSKLKTLDGVKATVREDGVIEMTCPKCGWVTHFSWSKREPR